MRINVNLTIDIPDPQQWIDTYGPNQPVRQDVKDHFLHVVQESAPFGTGEVAATVTLKD